MAGPVRCAVVGTPVAHSLSPAMHRAAYAELGLDWTYDAVELAAEDLEGFLAGLDGSWRGLSLTMPLKRTVVPLADQLDSWTSLSRVGNTAVREGGRLLVSNTDIPGALGALRERGVGAVESVVVLGGGATAASVLLALTDLGCRHATIAVRDPARAEETVTVVGRHPDAPEISVERLGDGAGRDVDVLVSTVPASAQTAEVLALADRAEAVFDVVYDPWPTPLTRARLDAGRTLVSGLDLLAHQAVGQLRLMTGREVPVDLVRDAGLAELRRRAVQTGPGRSEMA